MKTILASAAVLAAFSAAPAFAAPGDYDRGTPSYDRSDRDYGDRQRDGDRDGAYRDGGFDRSGGFNRDDGFRGRDGRSELTRLEFKINQGVRSGAVNRWEARELYTELRDVQDMQRQFWRTDGINPRERMILDRRTARLRADLWRASSTRDDRGWR